ncbi:hypothetical protein JJE68_00109 [Pediococcus acidilactici]|nr:hypothetical protein JJE68_00109 [Pediococcus acidilactici]
MGTTGGWKKLIVFSGLCVFIWQLFRSKRIAPHWPVQELKAKPAFAKSLPILI